MRKAIQSHRGRTGYSCLLLLSTLGAIGQGTFQNLGFETTTLTAILVNPLSGLYTTNATVPAWDWVPHSTAGHGDPNTTVSFNNSALSSSAVTLHGLNSYFPVIHGGYSIYLQGGSFVFDTNSYAAIFQTGQVPSGSHSLIYSGGSALQVFFNGQMLMPVALSNSANYTRWAADISAYAGQSGELLFRVPWRTASMLDDIQFSPLAIPEPGTWALLGLGSALFWCAARRHRK
jgi:hypothetical protein